MTSITRKIDRLAVRCGIALSYTDQKGDRIVASEVAKRRTLEALGIRAGNEVQIDQSLREAPENFSAKMSAPRGVRCFMADWLDQGRVWGIVIQLYQLRSARNWGIGDFADLSQITRLAAADGADFLGLNPLHALFLSDPARSSPFSPSNRKFLNPLYVAPDKVPGFEASDVDNDALKDVRQGCLVDYPKVWLLKDRALREIWRRWRGGRTMAKGRYSAEKFERFREDGGITLWRHALFEAISGALKQQGYGSGWHGWPEKFRNPLTKEISDFAANNIEEIEYNAWLQWVADTQLNEARETAKAAGMRIGLYLDLAVGDAPDGSATWTDPEITVPTLRIGAPPDYFNKDGQDWGLAPVSPIAMRNQELGPYREIIGSVMRHADAVRIDHAMRLYQLFVIPDELTARDGVYLRYPMADLLRVLAEQSHENRSIVIGEDLGTVPEGFRRVMRSCEIQSYRILYFEHAGKYLRAPGRYPRKALACLSTHDLPTLEGWWAGDDIALRRHFGFIDGEDARQQQADRLIERRGLARALLRSGLLKPASAELGADFDGPLDDSVAAAIHGHVATAPSRLFAVRLEDLAGETAPVNVPSTTDEYPNWRRRLSMNIEEIFASPRCRRIVEMMTLARPRD